MNVLITICGIALLLGGGEVLVKGAAGLARGLGISSLAVGLTVVAFGTSAPELAVSVKAALSGAGTLAFGNIFGSNMANIGLIVGTCAMLRPLVIKSVVVRRELPMMLLAVAAAVIMALDRELGEPSSRYARSDGWILLLFFIVFIYYTLGDLVQRRESDRLFDTDAVVPLPADGKGPPPSTPWAVLMMLAGLVGLLVGAQLTVTGGVGIARALGVSEAIVGLTLVSIGTSLPELVASLAAVRRGEIDLAVGGVVGSNIFNILLVCGIASVVQPIPIPSGGLLDLGVTAVLSLALLLTARTHNQLIMRYEGALLLVIYMSYMVWRSLFRVG